MTRIEQLSAFDSIVSRMRQIMISKGDDYANDLDRLNNFKVVGAITKTSTEGAVLTLIATKVARLSELFGGKTPNNEGIEDSALDLTIYGILLQMILMEKREVEDELPF